LGNYGSAVLAEADGFGVGFTPISPIHLEDENGRSQALVYSLPGAPVRYRLMRHPDIASVSQQRMLAATEKLQETEFTKRYSSLPRLVDAVDMPVPVLATARSILSFVEILHGRDVERGTFCSELVAIFFSEIGLPLFLENRNPSEISPNHLASCLLFEVPDAFLMADQISGSWKMRENLTLPMFNRSTFLPFTIRRKEQANEIQEVVGSIQTILNGNISALEREANILHINLQHEINIAALQCDAFGDMTRGTRIRAFALRLRLLSFLRASVYAHGKSIREGGRIEEIKSWAPASVALIRLWQTLTLNIQHAFLRSSIMLALSITRRVRVTTRSPLKYLQMQYRRKLLIRQWQKHCKERAATSEKLMLLLHDSNMSEQSLYYFDLTVSMAEQAALNELSQGQSISA
jgi:hypothetical protein